MITMTDFFCGAGGSSTGAVSTGAVEVTLASNHWTKAIEVHAANHPRTDHACVDLQAIRPSYFPTTDLLWASPECTNHSVAKGRRAADQTPDLFGDTLPADAAERSRATMFTVPDFAEHHRYRAIIVENVVDVRRWVRWPAWVMDMRNLGYEMEIVYLNAMHAQLAGLPAPQSRDRIYIVLWLKGTRRPDLERVTRPQAWCPSCDQIVEARQVWKKPDQPWGRYRAQYVFVCPETSCQSQIVEPAWVPASAAIDWSLEGQRIGDRAKPLSPKTMARIKAGLARYANEIIVEAAGNTYDAASPRHPRFGSPDGYYRAWPASEPLRTLHTTTSKGLLIPTEGREGKRASLTGEPLRTQTTRNELGILTTLRGHNTPELSRDPLDTVTASGNHHGLLVPYYSSSQSGRSTSEPMGTLTTTDRYALIMRNNTARGDDGQMSTPSYEPLRTLTTSGHQSVLEPASIDVNDCRFRMLEPHEIAAGMAFPTDYQWQGNKRERVRMAGNAVCPPAARDLVTVVAEALERAA
ncbi:DNA cytosine methyltransferase [Collinsella sp. Sow4_E3]|uniref:DNA cytosine methyltransferase n=1 Tax=Collinsella sp. Sow4_E3 TaxID=3438776 RepID=UPI003F91FB32